MSTKKTTAAPAPADEITIGFTPDEVQTLIQAIDGLVRHAPSALQAANDLMPLAVKISQAAAPQA